MNQKTVIRDHQATVFLTPTSGASVYLVAQAGGDNPMAVYSRLAELLKKHDLQIVHERIFGSIDSQYFILKSREAALGSQLSPLTFVQGKPISGSLAGVQIQAVRRSASVRTISAGPQPVGRSWTSGGRTFFMLQNIHGRPADPRGEQARQMFSLAEQVLRSEGASYRHVARTWIYLHNILDWYGDFNAARNELYTRFGVMAGDGKTFPPASTGIKAANPSGAACTMDVLAVVDSASPDAPAAKQLSNPLQQDAFLYGSAFSRACHVAESDSAFVQISGTAAIDERGKSMHIGDTRKQTETTLDIVENLIGQRGMKLADIASATAFIKNPSDLSIVQEVLSKRGLSDMPTIFVHADVCRGDLLFELDGVAAR